MTTGPPPLLTRPLLLRFASMVGASLSFFLLLSVVPAYAAERGGGGAAGLATGSLMLATVLGELGTPRLVVRFGYRLTLIAGLFLLGAPALVLTVSGQAAWIAAVCFVRGLGFALTIVAGGALTASLIPDQRRGEGLALVRVVSGVPSLVALPLGLWLAERVGYGPVAVAGGLAALAAITFVIGLPNRANPADPANPADGTEQPLGVVRGLRTGALLRPVLVFAATATAAGIVVTFLPLAVPSASAGVIAVALFTQTAASTLTRWLAGRHGDRHGSARLVLPGLLLSATGVLVIAPTTNPIAVVTGTALFGAGFGITQNATLAVMYTRVTAASYGTVSALWNLAYDGGMGVGAAGFGIAAGLTGYPWAFALTALLMLTAVAPSIRDRQVTPPSAHPPAPAADPR
ncbi:MFS transporter [Streptomyces sp. NPDC088196]|uniref:MFS transporter n=1 Tax=Streptomyces sp. NPDC088196 TaxID=3154868 RepID=UPI00344B6AD8